MDLIFFKSRVAFNRSSFLLNLLNEEVGFLSYKREFVLGGSFFSKRKYGVLQYQVVLVNPVGDAD